MTDLERRKMWFGKDYLGAAILAVPAERIAGFLDEYLIQMRGASHSMRGALAIVIGNVFHEIGRVSPRDENKRGLWMQELEKLCLRNEHELEFFMPKFQDFIGVEGIVICPPHYNGTDPFIGF